MRTHFGQAKSHTRTVQSALAVARMLRILLFQERPRTEWVWPPREEVGVVSNLALLD